MKKRLLALALCLVMVTSLLPITAAAAGILYIDSVEINASGVKAQETPEGYTLDVSSWEIQYTNELGIKGTFNANTGNQFSCTRIAVDEDITVPLTTRPMDGKTYYVKVIIYSIPRSEFEPPDEFRYDESRSPKITLNLPGYTTSCKKANDRIALLVLTFSLTKDHDWKFTVSENNDTLTAECKNNDTDPISVTLKADSVTLPNSPFNAQLVGWEQFHDTFQTATAVFDYKCDGVAVTDQSNPKAGKYQAGVAISGLPGTIVYAGKENTVSPENYAYLFTQYTAVDPAITAQTGDNRPIELMVGSVVVFSALAAAAFIADSKRRSHQ